ncbi:hypothetical protein CIB48_g7436 [Xylaria polymorpha]|nr:hypothetical protein CIB48_g7436 [Xylaria polymorpha]
MASIFGTVHRNWLMSNPSTVPKSSKPLSFGILGAADIGPSAIILPARSHPDVVIQTVAARDPAKATAYAQKHGIPNVAKTYQDILDDPKIDCVYIPLPNGLHYVWAQRALKAGKHVLLEKPSVNNSTEAERLFLSPTPDLPRSPSSPPQPVLLEATHSFFHPAWALFMSHVTPGAVASAKSSLWVPRFVFGPEDIRYNFELGGGALMDLGAYTASTLAHIFGAVAEECLSCETSAHADTDPRPVVLASAPAGVEIKEGEEVLRTREIRFANFVQPGLFHSITVSDQFVVRKVGAPAGSAPRKSWKQSKTVKAYTWREAGLAGSETQPGEPFWSTYRYQLEQFVNKVRGRDTPQWIDGADSVGTMRMIDMAYTAAKLPLRPTSEE